MKTFWIIIAIVYGVAFIPALRTAIAFWLHKDHDATAYLAMQHGFLAGFFKIWVIYPFSIIKDCINSLKGNKDE
jgi:hypothetical protein